MTIKVIFPGNGMLIKTGLLCFWSFKENIVQEEKITVLGLRKYVIRLWQIIVCMNVQKTILDMTLKLDVYHHKEKHVLQRPVLLITVMHNNSFKAFVCIL